MLRCIRSRLHVQNHAPAKEVAKCYIILLKSTGNCANLVKRAGFRATIEKIDGICETVTVCQVKTYNREEDVF